MYNKLRLNSDPLSVSTKYHTNTFQFTYKTGYIALKLHKNL